MAQVTKSNPVKIPVVTFNTFIAREYAQLRRHQHDAQVAFYDARPTEESDSVAAGDILLGTSHPPDTKHAISRGMPVSACMNGMRADGSTEEEQLRNLADSMTFAGIAQSPAAYNEHNGTIKTIASVGEGIATVTNTWNQALTKGDYVELAPPAKDLHDCADVNDRTGPAKDKKIRPLTKRCTWKLDDYIKSVLRTAPDKVTLTTQSSKTVPAEQECWAAVTGYMAVGAGMVGYILSQLGAEIEAAGLLGGAVGDEQERILAEFGRQVHGKDVDAVAVYIDLLGGVTVDRLPKIDIAGTMPPKAIDMAVFREKIVNESRRRLIEAGAAFGAVKKGANADVSPENPFGATVMEATGRMERKRSYDDAFGASGNVHMTEALLNVENAPVELARPIQMELRRKTRRVIGKVIDGGQPGSATVIYVGSPAIPISG